MGSIRRIIDRLSLQILCLGILASLLLSGCVDYDVGIRFDSANRGELTQHIRVGEQLRSLSGPITQQTLATLEQQGRSLGGKVQSLSPEELIVTIPFSSGADLATKFNQFFSPVQQDSSATNAKTDLPSISSHLTVTSNNLLLIERIRLRYDLDLRSLGISSSQGEALLSPTRLLNLEFKLLTPWTARAVVSDILNAPVQQAGQQLVWKLIPGQINHLEAVFWLPNSLGIGSAVILVLVLVGYFLKGLRSPKPTDILESNS